jgi:hypothetical protein
MISSSVGSSPASLLMAASEARPPAESGSRSPAKFDIVAANDILFVVISHLPI